MTSAPDWIEACVGLTVLVGAIYGFFRWVRPRWRAARAKWVMAVDSLVGRDAIVDSITGEEKSPALPGVGVRMAHQEQQMELLTVTVTKLVDNQAHQLKLEGRVDDLDDRVAKLEANQVERVVARAETTAAYRAIEEAIKATPDQEADADEDE
jgi:hypothetical protein